MNAASLNSSPNSSLIGSVGTVVRSAIPRSDALDAVKRMGAAQVAGDELSFGRSASDSRSSASGLMSGLIIPAAGAGQSRYVAATLQSFSITRQLKTSMVSRYYSMLDKSGGLDQDGASDPAAKSREDQGDNGQAAQGADANSQTAEAGAPVERAAAASEAQPGQADDAGSRQAADAIGSVSINLMI